MRHDHTMSSTRPRPVRSILAWPRDRARNPYTAVLYDAMATVAAEDGEPVEILEFRVATAWKQKVDIVHVHWPEACVESPSRLRAAAKTAVVAFDLAVLRARGATLVWTCHNITSHEGHHPRIERLLRWYFLRMLGGVLQLSPEAAASAPATMPALRTVPSEVVRLCSYSDDIAVLDQAKARGHFDIEADATVLAAVGSIRPYKNIPNLVRAFAATDFDRPTHLLIAGSVSDAALRDELEEVTAGAERVHLNIGWIDDEELSRYIGAADAVVLPYRRIDNSGAAILTLNSGRPVAITRSASIEDLAELAGDEWLRPLDGEVDPTMLLDIVDWADQPRGDKADLAALSPANIARETLAAFRRFHNS